LRIGRIDIFHQQHVVPTFAVNEFVDQLFCQQKPEATWTETLSFANCEVAQRIVGRTVNSRMAELFQRKALTRIFDAAYHRTTHADERNFNIMAGVETPAVLHGVEEDFPESGNDGLPISLGNAGVFDATKELDQAICRGHSQRAAKRTQAVVPDRTSMPSSQQGAAIAACNMSASSEAWNGAEK